MSNERQTPPTSAMVRRGVVQAQQSDQGFNFFAMEVTLASIGGGLLYHSWLVGVGVLVGGVILIMIPYIRAIFSFCLSAAWGIAGYSFGAYVLHDKNAGYAIGGLAFLATLGLHMQAIQRGADMDPSI